jgi:hypothetical protein
VLSYAGHPAPTTTAIGRFVAPSALQLRHLSGEGRMAGEEDVMRGWAVIFCALVVLTGVFVLGQPEGALGWLLRGMLFLIGALVVVTLAARRRSADQPPT